MTEFVEQPLNKLLNKRNPLTRIENLEQKTGARPSATINQLQELIENQPSLFISGVVFIGDSNNPYFILQNRTGVEVARLYQDGAGNLQWDLADATKSYTFNDGSVIAGHGTGVDSYFSLHENFTRKAATWWDASEANATLENYVSGGNILLVLEGSAGTEKVGLVYSRTDGVSYLRGGVDGLVELRGTSTTDLPASGYMGLYASTDSHLYDRTPGGTSKLIDKMFLPLGPYIHTGLLTAAPSYPYAQSVGQTINFVQWDQMWRVQTTNDANNYWQISIKRYSDNATINTFATSAGSPNTWYLNTDTSWLVSSLDSSGQGCYIECAKAGSGAAPGGLYLPGPMIEIYM